MNATKKKPKNKDKKTVAKSGGARLRREREEEGGVQDHLQLNS